MCSDAVATIMLFDLTRPSTLSCMKDLYKALRKYNKFAVPVLLGINYCQFCDRSEEDRTRIVAMARKCARAMKCPLIFADSEPLINVTKLYTVLLQLVLSLPLSVEEEHDPDFPLVECTPPPVPERGSSPAQPSPAPPLEVIRIPSPPTTGPTIPFLSHRDYEEG